MAGSITPYSTAGGKRYRVRYRKPDKSQTDKRGFRTKRDAELFLASVTVSKASGAYLDPTEGRKTVAAFAEQWKSGRLAGLKPSSQNAMETAWRVHVEPKWGARGAAGIRSSEVEDWVIELGRKLSAQTTRRAVFVLSRVLAIAERDRVIASSPMKGAQLPARARKPQRYLTHHRSGLLPPPLAPKARSSTSSPTAASDGAKRRHSACTTSTCSGDGSASRRTPST